MCGFRVATIHGMTPRRAAPQFKPADWPPDQTYFALKKQLSALDNFRGRQWRDVEHEETSWRNLTLNVLTHGFGEESNNVNQFHHAKWAGEHYMGGMSEAVIQRNFEQRIEALAAMVQSSLNELEYMAPKAGIAGAYEPGDEYGFYRDLKVVVGLAQKELLIVDNYLDTQLFDVYMENIGGAVDIRVLTNNVNLSLRVVAQKFANRGRFELRSGSDVHDRVVFADDRCWVIGQSIKDAARKKPTYIVEHTGAASMKSIYESIWAVSGLVVKG
jgi:hypothetical protein